MDIVMEYEAYCLRALRSYENKEWINAYSLINKVLCFDPEDSEWLYRMAKSSLKVYKCSEALMYCKKYLESNKSEKAQKLLVKIYIEMNQLEIALENCSERLREIIYEEMRMDDLREDAKPINDLKSWVISNGGQINSIKIRHFSTKFRGVASSMHIESCSTILFIPSTLILYAENCITPLTQQFANKFTCQHSLFALFIMLELKSPSTPWALYLSTLPTDFSSFPYFFTKPELDNLKGSSMLKLLEVDRKSIEDEFSFISASNLLTFEEFLKGRLLVSSRLFSIKSSEDRSGLIPYADFFNHKPHSTVSWNYDFEAEGIKIEIADSVVRNEEICIDYGNKSNLKLMLGYGFAIEGNLYDEFVFFLRIKKSDMMFERKQRLLGMKKQFKAVMETANVDFLQLLGFARLRVYQGVTHFEDWEKSYNLKNIGFISTENELDALNYLKGKCEKSLLRFPESLNGEPSANFHNILLLTSGEKRVLEWTIFFCSTAIEIIRSSTQITPKAFPETYQHYLRTIALKLS